MASIKMCHVANVLAVAWLAVRNTWQPAAGMVVDEATTLPALRQSIVTAWHLRRKHRLDGVTCGVRGEEKNAAAAWKVTGIADNR